MKWSAEIRDAGRHACQRWKAGSHALAMDRLLGLPLRSSGRFHESHTRSSRLSRDIRRLFRRKEKTFRRHGSGRSGRRGSQRGRSVFRAALAGLAKRDLTYGLKGSPDLSAAGIFPEAFPACTCTARRHGTMHVESALLGRIKPSTIFSPRLARGSGSIFSGRRRSKGALRGSKMFRERFELNRRRAAISSGRGLRAYRRRAAQSDFHGPRDRRHRA